MFISFDPVIPLLGIYWREIIQNKKKGEGAISTQMFITSLYKQESNSKRNVQLEWNMKYISG